MTTPRPSLARAAGYTAAATLVYLAGVIAGFGMVSLITDTEVVDEPALGTLPGPIAIMVTGVLFALGTLRALDRAGRGDAAAESWATRILSAFWIGLAVLAGYTASLVIALVWNGLDEFTPALVHTLLRPYPWTAAAIASAIILALLPLSAAALRGHTPRRWYWEDDETE
ncbi:hypothetical protein [Mycetocola saprophilus]|uniref:hypothetical protein n=1 Tax=Mycetocola saprophilus TaxID=76636 RepID=UPI003BEF6850